MPIFVGDAIFQVRPLMDAPELWMRTANLYNSALRRAGRQVCLPGPPGLPCKQAHLSTGDDKLKWMEEEITHIQSENDVNA